MCRIAKLRLSIDPADVAAFEPVVNDIKGYALRLKRIKTMIILIGRLSLACGPFFLHEASGRNGFASEGKLRSAV